MPSDRRDYMRSYMREYRARQKGGNSTAPNVHNACDRRIAELIEENRVLKERIRDFEAAVAFIDEEPGV